MKLTRKAALSPFLSHALAAKREQIGQTNGLETKMARKLMALIAKLRGSEDTVFAHRVSMLAESVTPGRLHGPLSPFRFVAQRRAV